MLISPFLLSQGDVLSQSLSAPKDFQPGAKRKDAYMDTLLEGHFLFFWRMHRSCQPVHLLYILYISRQQSPDVLSPSYMAARQCGLNQPCSWLFEGCKPVGPMQQNKLFWNSQWRDCPSPLQSGRRLFQDVILLCPLVWVPNQHSSSIVNSTQGWKWPVMEQISCRGSPICDPLTTKLSSFLPVILFFWWWFCGVFLLVFFSFTRGLFVYFRVWWDPEKVQIKCWREAPQMQAEGAAWLPRWERREGLQRLTIKLSSPAGPYPSPLPALFPAVLSATVILLPWASPRHTQHTRESTTLWNTWTEQELSQLTAWEWMSWKGLRSWYGNPQSQLPLATRYPSSDKASQGTSYGFYKKP